MKLFLRLAIKEIFKNRKFSFFFILNMSIGLTGFIAINSFSSSFNKYMENNLREILTADFMIMSSRPLTAEENKITEEILGKNRKESRQTVFYSMVKGKNSSKLAQILAIDENFPLYGKFHVDSNNSSTINSTIQKTPFALSEKDLATSFGLKRGESIQIGSKHFKLNNYIIDSDKAVTSIEFAPKIFIGLDQLKGTGLIKYGSRVRYIRYYMFPDGTDIKKITDKLKKKYENFYNEESEIRIFDSSSVNRRLSRIIDNFAGYLGLIAIGALFLAGIATAYLFRGYLNLKLKEISILMSIGATRFEACFLFFGQLFFLGFLASLLSILFTAFILPVFPVILKGIIPTGLNISINTTSTITALTMGTAGAMIFCLPVIARVYNVKPLTLLRELKNSNGSVKHKVMTGLGFLPAFILFLILSTILTDSILKGSVFTIGFLLIMVIFGLFGWMIFNGCKYLSKKSGVILKIAFRNLYRNKLSSISCFVTISMGVFLINMIPQIQHGIQEEIERPEGLKIPVFFLIDVQEEQLNPVKDFIKEQNHNLSNISPIVIGRITSINGEGFYKRRKKMDQKSRRRYRRLEYNFSTRDELGNSENIVEGIPLTKDKWDFESNKPFEISLAKSFADNNKIKIGDIMSFDIQGMPLTGKVVNFRKVRWNSFQPNFYMLLQKGVLDDAPKTYLASISAIKVSERQKLKNMIFDNFSNISVIDVTKTIEQILRITDKLSLSIKFMAYLAILAGLVSIYSIARHEAKKHEKEINLLKILGSGFNDIRKITSFEFGFIGLTASVFAIIISFIFSYGVSFYFFDRLWSFQWEYGVFIVIVTTLICILTALFATDRVIRKKAIILLGS
ncbi:MAG: ABC transporter permease [Desulfobacterales bacterium]|nr:ABC transporter permease [Desulfobacterales bacterium]MCP4162488.1 ABC transporter permease [Deltaproteobacteria bacterium]